MIQWTLYDVDTHWVIDCGGPESYLGIGYEGIAASNCPLIGTTEPIGWDIKPDEHIPSCYK